MRTTLILITLAFFLTACGDETESGPIPPELIASEQRTFSFKPQGLEDPPESYTWSLGNGAPIAEDLIVTISAPHLRGADALSRWRLRVNCPEPEPGQAESQQGGDPPETIEVNIPAGMTCEMSLLLAVNNRDYPAIAGESWTIGIASNAPGADAITLQVVVE